MGCRTTSSKRMLFTLFTLVSLSWASLSAQETISGKLVRTGIWEGRQIEYLEGEIAIILNPGVVQADVLPLLQSHGATIKRDFDKLRWGLIELPEAVDVLSLAATLKRNPLIEVAEPNMVVRAGFDPNDPYYQGTSPATYSHQWGLNNTGQNPPGGTSDADIDAPEVWNITMGSSSVIIAILDSGIPLVNGNLSHPDLDDPSKFILGPDYVDKPADGVRDDRGHGTHVTGIAAAETNNGTGIAGVCGNCRVMVIQVFNALGLGSHEAFRDGVIYAVDNGADVINYSGGGTPSATKEQAVQYANQRFVPIVASTGNTNPSGGPVIWPAAYSASYSNVIAVGATDHKDVRSSYSNYGLELTVVAPGGYGSTRNADDIYSTTPNYDFTLQGSGTPLNYGYLAGTSMAAPHVAGVAGLILSANPCKTPAEIRNIIENTADKVPGMGGNNFTIYYGYGRLNAFEAVNSLDPPAAPTGLIIA